MRIATWNLKQAVAPKKPLSDLWRWMEREVSPNVIILTEAKVPHGGMSNWTTQWNPEGVGPRRRWGTVLAGRNVELHKVSQAEIRGRQIPINHQWPSIIEIADVLIHGERWGTIAGIYGLTVDRDGQSCGHGLHTTRLALEELKPLLESDRFERLILGGDFNLWPIHVPSLLRTEMVDLIEASGADRGPLPGCSGCDLGNSCCHVWTHKNGNSPNAARQQIDYLFASPALAEDLIDVAAGIGDFPDAWEMSDHAPVVAEFSR